MQTCSFDLTERLPAVATSGFSGIEPFGRWTDGPSARLTLPVEDSAAPVLLLTFELRAYVSGKALPEQNVEVAVSGKPVANWLLHDNRFFKRILEIERAALPTQSEIELEFRIPNCAQPFTLGDGPDRRFLGMMLRRVTIEGVAQPPPPDSLLWQLGRPVGLEAAKSFDRHIESGFWSRFVVGPKVLDIGFRGYGGTVVPILEGAVGVDLDYPGYDGRTLPFPDGSQDAVFSSHCLEHIPYHLQVIQDWFRVTRVGGHIITIVPHAHLYERRQRLPSRWTHDHLRLYTPASLLAEFEAALTPNTYRVRLLEDNDRDYRYEDPPSVHPSGCYEIILVIQKIGPPAWRLDE